MISDKQEMIALLTGVKSSKRNYYTELKKTVEQLKKKNMQLEIMNEIMKSIKVDTQPGDILQNVVHKLGEIIRFERLSLFLLQNDELLMTNVYPSHSHILDIGAPIPSENSLYWLALTDRKIIFQNLQLPDVHFYEKEFLTGLHIQSILVLPIYSKNKKIGVLSIGRRDTSEWSFDDLVFLEQLTDHLSVSIENAQLYNEVLRGKQQWEDTFKAVKDMIIVFDQDLNILQYNDSVKPFFPQGQPQLVPVLQDVCQSLVQETFEGKQPGYKEIYISHDLTCEIYTYPIQNTDDEVYGVIAYIKDVTEKRKIEAQLLHSGKLAAIGEMAAGVAHELNSPLTAILGNSQLLLRNITHEDPAFTLLNDIKNCGNRCKQIVKSLLTFARQDEYFFDSCSLNDAVAQVLNLLKYQLEKNEITIRRQLQHDLPLIEASQPQIEQIIINLLLNAKDALDVTDRQGKEIIIHTSLHGDEVRLSVTDNGIGMDEHQLSKIFHPFYTTKEEEKGTGLGLSVSIGIAKAHGGTIEVQSALHRGSTFTLRLPIHLSKQIEVTS